MICISKTDIDIFSDIRNVVDCFHGEKNVITGHAFDAPLVRQPSEMHLQAAVPGRLPYRRSRSLISGKGRYLHIEAGCNPFYRISEILAVFTCLPMENILIYDILIH